MLPPAITVTYRRYTGPPFGRLAPAPTLRAGARCRLALTPGRPGGPGLIRSTYTSSNLCPRVLRLKKDPVFADELIEAFIARKIAGIRRFLCCARQIEKGASVLD